ncbi:MAG: sugar ABC transporter ATP-binding protein [Lachnospiraceae bacterium]|nr:sugar ABC transporter ATP-binding protein [Lachnospiraceae bacterium]
MSDNILEVRGLTKLYPGVTALDQVDFSVKRGEVHGLIGENGAGKSTLIKCVTGAITPTSGTIVFNEKEYTHLDPHSSSEIGIGVIYQEFSLVPALSVAENVFLGNYLQKGPLIDFKAMEKKTEEAMKQIGVYIPPKTMVWYLTVGHQQITEITRALVKNCSLLIMDEPTAPLTNAEVDQLYAIIRNLKAQGMSIIYVSHRLEELFEVTDRITVLRDGRFIATMDTGATNKQELIKLMVGRELSTDFPERTMPIGEEILKVENLSGNGVENINFTLHRGEILGFAGLLGCGRSETMQMLYGAAKKQSGTVTLHGEEVNFKETAQAMKKGLGYIPEDRKRQGLFLWKGVDFNLTISALKKFMNWCFLSRRKEKTLVDEYLNKLTIKTPSRQQLVMNLSGGNQQKVIVSKVLATDADIMVFDEPTRGIDVGAKAEMYQLIRNLTEEGHSVILVSSEMNEVIGLSDRIVVLCEGKQMGILERNEFDQEKIMALASGESA